MAAPQELASYIGAGAPAEELAARAEAERVRDQIRETEAVVGPQLDARLGGGALTPPPLF